MFHKLQFLTGGIALPQERTEDATEYSEKLVPTAPRLRETAWMDGLRGWACMLVYIHHTTEWWFEDSSWGYLQAPDKISYLRLPFVRSFFASGPAMVSLFFVLSGFVLVHKQLRMIRGGDDAGLLRHMSSAVFRRFWRLYLPMFCETLLYLIMLRSTTMKELGPFRPPYLGVPNLPSFTEQLMHWYADTTRRVNPFSWKSGFPDSYGVYEVNTWTIVLEYQCSIVLYLTVLWMGSIKSYKLRNILFAAASAFAYSRGAWFMVCFYGGAMLADYDLYCKDAALEKETAILDMDASLEPPPKEATAVAKAKTLFWWCMLLVCVWLQGVPHMQPGRSVTAYGFEFLLRLTPTWYPDQVHYWGMLSGILTLVSIYHLPRMQGLMELALSQWFGKISFSLYLVHGAVGDALVSLCGIALRRHAETGLPNLVGFAATLVFGTAITLACANFFHRFVDAPSIRFSAWLYKKAVAFNY